MKLSGKICDILKEKGTKTFSIFPDATVFEAIQMMADRNVGALIVLSHNKIFGIISERDYTRKVILKGGASKKTSVEAIMTRKVITVDRNASVEDALKLMTHRKIRHLPVVSSRKLVGMVSVGDLVKWVISEQSATMDQLEHYITGAYPG